MRGSKVSDEVEVEFREHYLATGNATAAARAVGLSPRTGIDLAKRANADEEFAQARREMYARALPDGEAMLFAGMQVALERLNKGPEEVIAKLAMLGGEVAKVSYQDPGAQYLRSLAAAVDVIAKIRKLDAEKNGDIGQPSTVNIVVSPTGSEPAKQAAAADPEDENGD
ncbi:DNA binding domain binding domain [Caudoviricetes sp.]|nr:DNA binding domain binding domain [Caudoviricetes sp.]